VAGSSAQRAAKPLVAPSDDSDAPAAEADSSDEAAEADSSDEAAEEPTTEEKEEEEDDGFSRTKRRRVQRERRKPVVARPKQALTPEKVALHEAAERARLRREKRKSLDLGGLGHLVGGGARKRLAHVISLVDVEDASDEDIQLEQLAGIKDSLSHSAAELARVDKGEGACAIGQGGRRGVVDLYVLAQVAVMPLPCTMAQQQALPMPAFFCMS
jgi:hypothetical protein